MNHYTDEEDGRPPPDFEAIKTTFLGSLLSARLTLSPARRSLQFTSSRSALPFGAPETCAQKARRLGPAPAA